MYADIDQAGLQTRVARGLLLSLLLSSLAGGLSTPAWSAPEAVKQLSADDYRRAERFLVPNKDKYLLNDGIQHHWIEGQDKFWYRRSPVPGASEFVLVDAASGKRSPAFDHARVAAGLSKALGKPVSATELPFASFRFARQGKAIEFILSGEPGADKPEADKSGADQPGTDKFWTCETGREQCSSGALPPQAEPGLAVSPNGKWAAFVRDHNLWVKATDGSGEFALTTDGVEHYGYAGSPATNTHTISTLRSGMPEAPYLAWSPDSTKLLTHRIDERLVKELALLQSVPDDGSFRARLWTYRYAMPNDEHRPLVEQMVFDVAARKRVNLDFPVLASPYTTPVETHEAWWSPDGKQVNYIERGKYFRTLTWRVADASTGKASTLLEESGKTYIELNGIGRHPMAQRLSNGDLIWFSERSGWGHLYLYGKDGRLKHPITQGEWLVRGIVRVDERSNTIYFTAAGREAGSNPYDRRLYKARLDGSGLQLLTPENADHVVAIPGDALFTGHEPNPLGTEQDTFGMSPSGKYFVDVYSRPDLPSVSALRAADGRMITTLETADISRLSKAGFTMPEPFQATAADGTTAIYGAILRPSTFDPARKYPVIDSIYPGPQVVRTWRNFGLTAYDWNGAQALAELGFIVVTVDGRGTPLRNKAFVDDSYANLGSAGNLDDHIAALRQLAKRYPYMDLERVGIYGASGGGYASTHALLKYPDFYKVAVSGAGNHDQRGYLPIWGETYNGPDNGKNYLEAANAPLANNLRGKLLLIHGELDDNVHPALTLQVVDALIKANKDFDMLIVPGANHGVMGYPYATRRQWDYFVRNLLGAEPPAGYEIGAPSDQGEH